MGEQATAGEEQRLKQRAMRRLAVALALIAAAIAGLAVLDHYATRKKTAAPAAPSSEPAPTASQPQPAPFEPPAAAEAVTPEVPAAEGPAAEAPALPPPPPKFGEGPAPEARVPVPPKPPAAAQIEEGTGAPTTARTPAARLPAAAGAPPAGAEPRPGFVVQLGVFTSVENAQSLQSRLKQQGIPVFLETRVVVGPFRDRAEAEAAQRKLEELGVAGVIVQRK